MDLNTNELFARTIGEFLIFLAILIGGSLAGVWLSNQFSPPATAVVSGATIVAVAVVGTGWLWYTAPGHDQKNLSSSLAVVGAICIVLAIQRFIEGDTYAALGIAVGGLLFTTGNIISGGR